MPWKALEIQTSKTSLGWQSLDLAISKGITEIIHCREEASMHKLLYHSISIWTSECMCIVYNIYIVWIMFTNHN